MTYPSALFRSLEKTGLLSTRTSAVVAAIMLAFVPVLHANPLYYDTNAGTVGLQGGAGTWDVNTTAVWNQSATGANNTLVTFQSGNDVHFTATNTASTVTIASGGVNPGSTTISAASNTYTFVGGLITSGSISKSGDSTANFGNTATVLTNGYDQSFTFGGGTTITGGTLRYVVTSAGLSTTNPHTFAFGTENIALNGGTFSFSVNANTSGEHKGFILSNSFDISGTGNTISTGRSTSTNNNPTAINISGGLNLENRASVTFELAQAGTAMSERQVQGTVTVRGDVTIARNAGARDNDNFALTGNIVNGVTSGVLSLRNDGTTSTRLFRIAGTNNTYSGGTAILSGAGTVQVAANSKLGTGNVSVANGTASLVELSLLGNTNIDSSASLTIATGAQVHLGFANTTLGIADVSDMYLTSLTLGGTTYSRNFTNDQVFNATTHGAFFTGTGEIVLAMIPEPSSLCLLGLGLLGLLGRRRR